MPGNPLEIQESLIARAAAGRILPFWEGRVTQIRFVSGD
jgi:hypothetical protein